MRGLDEQMSIGDRVAWYRRRRGISQEVLAGTVGRTVDWLSKVENGRAALDRLSVLRSLAEALGVELVDLLGGPQLAEAPVPPRRSGVPALRRTVLGYGEQTSAAVREPATGTQLRSAVGELFDAYQDARFGYVTARLPVVLDDARNAAEQDDPANAEVAAGHLAMTYQAAATVLGKVGETDLAWVCSDRGLAAAERSRNPVVIGSLLRSVAHSLLSTGQFGEAFTVADRAARRLSGEAPAPSPQQVSIIGSLLLVAAISAARADDPVAARAMLKQAGAEADRLRYDANLVWTAFGPTNVAIHRVSVAMELDEVQVAVNLGPRIDASGMPVERRVRHGLEVARALTRNNEPAAGLARLLTAEVEAPEQVRQHYGRFTPRRLLEHRSARPTHPPPERSESSMFRSTIGTAAMRPSRFLRLPIVASTTAVALGLTLAAGAGSAVAAARTSDGSAPVVTRAALDPALVAGRGASVGFAEQEAENAATNGTILGPDRSPYTLAAEASGRKAVTLARKQFVEFTLPSAANAITVRYSIPDAPTGGGITAPLDVTVNGAHHQSMTLTSQYAWLYNQYPFSNDPNAGLLHPDWWITECSCVPNQATPPYQVSTPFRPNHFYDEQRLLLGRTYRAGDKVRLTVPAGRGVAGTVIDLLDSQLVAAPHIDLVAANVLLFGADPSGRRDSAGAFDRAIAFAKRAHLKVYVPPGTFQVNRHIIVDNVTVEGAGNWYTIIKGHQVSLSTPAPDGSVHTGVGFYGKDASVGGSSNVHLSGFAIEGDVRERIDLDQVNGIGGALSNSTIDSLYLQHTKVGIWLDGPMTNLRITNNQIVDQIADGINFHTGVTNSLVFNNFLRNTGDDGLAMWSEKIEDANNTFDHNTVQTPVLANGIAIYGGTDNTLSNNLIADPIREGSAIHVGSRFGAQAFTGHLWITNNTTVRAAAFELNWKIGLGAIWFYALEKNIDADIQVRGDNFLDNTYNAIMFVTDFPVKDQYSITGVHFSDIKVDGTGTSVVSARSAGSATFQNVDARNVGAVGVNNCGSFNFPATGSEFSLIDLGGNDGGGTTGPWLAPWELPNTITCDDHPTVVPPPPPSTW